MYFIYLLIIFRTYIYSLDIHVIPHSHMDPGWLKTYDEYYNQQVSQIFSNVYTQLTNSSQLKYANSRTFVFCEMINFEKWYTSKNEAIKSNIKALFHSGRIEFVGGGLVMHDEANSLYQDMIDQLRKGNQFLNNEFNTTSNVGWMLDPFGHSEGNALVHSQLGFEYLVINRIDYQEHDNRVSKGELEFTWKPFGLSKSIFTHITPYHYGTSMYFKFLHDEKAIPVQTKVYKVAEEFLDKIRNRTKGFQHDQYMFLLGDDFTFFKKEFLFERMELIMDYINSNTSQNDVRIFYSTPSKYFAAVKRELMKHNKSLPIEKHIDFYPYADKEYAYWTGYYTSRPYLKGMIKQLSNLYLTSSTYLVEMLLHNKIKLQDIQLTQIQKMIGLLQHHDAITGTAKEKVSNDYITNSKKAINATTSKVISMLLKDNYVSTSDRSSEDIKVCLSNPTVDYGCDNEFSMENANEKEMNIGIINPGINGEILITIELMKEENEYKVYNDNGNEIQSDFYCFDENYFQYNYKCFLTFFYTFSPHILVTSFTLKKYNTQHLKSSVLNYPSESITLIKNHNNIKLFAFHPDNETFSLHSFQDDTITEYNFTLQHAYYEGFVKLQNSTIRPKNSNSDGAYIFAPTNVRPVNISLDKANSFYNKGEISTTFFFSFNDLTYMVVSIYTSPFIVKVDSIIKPLHSYNNKNFVLQLQSNIRNNITFPDETEVNRTYAEFWTDSNGIQMKRRISDHRSYQYTFNDIIASNFYPVSTKISIREKQNKTYTPKQKSFLTSQDKQITIFTDRPQSGTSIREGEIMLLILRSSLTDDVRGVNEKLYESKSSRFYFKISHFIMIGSSIYTESPSVKNRYRSLQMVYNSLYRTPLLFKEHYKYAMTSRLNEMFIISDNVLRNVDIVNDMFVVVQLYRMYDYYFTMEKEEYGGLVTVRISDEKVKISVDYNGMKCVDVRNNILLREKTKKGFLQVLNNDVNMNFRLNKNEFIFVYLYFTTRNYWVYGKNCYDVRQSI